jgi:hypothetical protein
MRANGNPPHADGANMARQDDRPHPHIEFATQHGSQAYSMFTASAAISRCESLLADLDAMEEAKQALEAAGGTFGFGWFSFEIVSYYAVGFVTCLEWHARSRLVDLFSFKPSAAKGDDLAQINSKLLAQMIAEKVTVPLLLGAIMNVSDFERYCSIFKRLFDELNIDDHPKRLTSRLDKQAQDVGIIAPMHESLDEAITGLFVYRNHLVHEIDARIIGPWTLRDSLDIGFARQYGQVAQLIMVEIEKVISAKAPKTFPNLLDAQSNPIDKSEMLKEQIEALEADLTLKLAEAGNDETFARWAAAQNAYGAWKASEEELIDSCDHLAPMRYFNRRYEVKLLILEQRLAYLQSLIEDEVGISD